MLVLLPGHCRWLYSRFGGPAEFWWPFMKRTMGLMEDKEFRGTMRRTLLRMVDEALEGEMDAVKRVGLEEWVYELGRED